MMPHFLRSLGRRILGRRGVADGQPAIEHVAVRDKHREYVFRCDGPTDVWRARSLFVKEAGTVAWIRASVQPGDVFYDIGANIGLYSLLAADRIGPTGAVYAFEPHVVSFHSLLHNIVLNGFGGRIQPICAALHEREGLFDFNYRAWGSGSSMSQLGSTRDGDEQTFAPVVTEVKLALTLDRLVSDGMIRPPDHVKMDVDGNEMLILRGMRHLLRGKHRPRTLQVEINARYKSELFDFLAECGFEMYDRHFTQLGQSLLDAGKKPEEIPHNVLFRPRRAQLRKAS